MSTLNRRIQAEVWRLASQGLIDNARAERLAAQYPTTRWDVAVLVRWLTWLGALSAGAGAVILASELASWLRLAEAGLLLATAVAFWAGQDPLPARGLPKTAAAVELLGALAMQGLITALAVDFSTGSKNWPALVGISATAVLIAAYGLRNRLVLTLALADAFVWFGGETGYLSGWGAYWLGMDYPLRFLVAGAVSMGLAYLHTQLSNDQLRGFSRVYLHYGLLISNLALWFFSLFGYFEKEVRWEGTESQRVAFSLLWAAMSLGSLVAGSRLGQRALRGYGLTFLIIDVYTFYFQFVVANSAGAWFLHLLLTGGSLVALGVFLERRLRQERTATGSSGATGET